MRPLSKTVALLGLALITGISSAQAQAQAKPKKAHHVVIIWLKQHGDEAARQKYIEASKRLAKLEGIQIYNIGTPAEIKRERPSSAVDNSYDIAISSTFDNQEALESYLKNPAHFKVIQEELKPLVERYTVYDFVD